MAGPQAIDFEAVVTEFGDALARLAWGYTDHAADHAELVQEILVAIWEALPRFRRQASLRTYVFRIAHNRALTHAGRRNARRWVPLTETLHDPQPRPDEIAEARTERERLLAAIRLLPPALRQAVLLHLEGASPPEIADIQGITENNASVRLTRARQALKQLMEPDRGER